MNVDRGKVKTSPLITLMTLITQIKKSKIRRNRVIARDLMRTIRGHDASTASPRFPFWNSPGYIAGCLAFRIKLL
jgi:hypothetical protein